VLLSPRNRKSCGSRSSSSSQLVQVLSSIASFGVAV
jgi:hypothetical protein